MPQQRLEQMYKDSIQKHFKRMQQTMTFGKSCLLILSIFTLSNLHAQQLPLFTQYREHGSALNPALVSSDYMAFELQGSIGLSYRSQWTGLTTTPRTGIVQGHYLFDDFSGVNFMVGGHLLTDRTGPISTNGAYARVAGVISPDPRYGGLSIGLAVGAAQFGVAFDQLRLRDADDLVLTQDLNQVYPDVSIGIFYYQMIDNNRRRNNDFFYVGASAPQIIGNNVTFTDEVDGSFSVKKDMHIYGQAGLIKYFWDDSFIEPSVWVKYVENAPINVDFNVRYQFALGIWTGAGVSTAKAAHLEAGVLLGDNIGYERNLKIGYGFDYFFTDIGAAFGATHEVNIGYFFSN